MFLVIIGLIVGGNLLWWRWADRRVRTLTHGKLWRSIVGIFTSMQLLYILLFIFAPSIARRSHTFPMALMAMIYLWSLLVLPATLVILGIGSAWRFLVARFFNPCRGARHGLEAHATTEVAPSISGGNISRRQWLSATAVALPPIVAAGIAARSLVHLRDLRVRTIDVPVRNLPPALNGLTIAQVTDTHIGKFTRAGTLDRVVEMTNQLRADLVLFTGDLIDLSLADFGAGVDMINRLDPRHGLVMIEGNHDLIEDPAEFESRARSAGLPMLLDEARTLTIRGVPIQFLGIRWGKPDDGPRRRSNNEVIRECVTNVLRQRDPNAFPILLSHHPHAFDSAIDAKLPLTFSGHTHGGQLMLNERLGAGPIMFRYWSGLYRHGDCSLVVSNGAGNWFPLRINAPAEIVHATLRAI